MEKTTRSPMFGRCAILSLPLFLLPAAASAGTELPSPELVSKREPELCADVNDERRGGFEIEELRLWELEHGRCCEAVFGDLQNPATITPRERALCGLVATPWKLECGADAEPAAGRAQLSERGGERLFQQPPFDAGPRLDVLRAGRSPQMIPAMRELGRERIEAAVPLIVPLLDAGDSDIRRTAILALANIRGDGARSALRTVLEEGKRSSRDRSLAALGLGRMNDTESVSPMISVMQGAAEDDLPAFRLALRLLTGEDLGLVGTIWSEWWLTHGKRRPAAEPASDTKDELLKEYTKRLLCKRLAGSGATPEREDALTFAFSSVRELLIRGADILLIGEGEVRLNGASRNERHLGVLLRLEGRPRSPEFKEDMACHGALRHLSDPRMLVELSGAASFEAIETKLGNVRLYRLWKAARCQVGPAR